ncbi:thymidine phosphorylase, partial [Plesiomonas shigelloides]|nr:thymidine phosphorylase [Plesiomonas shigelloides]
GFSEHYGCGLPQASVIRPVDASGVGFVTARDGRALGMAVVGMGCGRRAAGDAVVYSVRFDQVLRRGRIAGASRPLALVHARNESE